jgi:peptide-methionine (R)-S-oxide reductase
VRPATLVVEGSYPCHGRDTARGGNIEPGCDSSGNAQRLKKKSRSNTRRARNVYVVSWRPIMKRRTFLTAALAAGPAAFVGCLANAEAPLSGDQPGGAKFEITKTEDEWRRLLTPGQFQVLRKRDTERPGSSALNDEHRSGTYHCAGCDLPVFVSTTKFESGTGWPSFTAPIPNAIGTSIDRGLFEIRTEVHCRRCGGHLGHVFDDGPAPTGKRYCMNGVAMVFRPAT